MTDVYFACRTCKIYRNAAYTWCYWTLERPGIVQRGNSLVVNAVLDASQYWQGSQEGVWLQDLLPRVKAFLEEHADHDLMYGDDDDIGLTPRTDDDYRFLDWLNDYEDDDSGLLPRYFIERRGYKYWQQVREHMARLEQAPWWWHDSRLREKAMQKFVFLSVPWIGFVNQF